LQVRNDGTGEDAALLNEACGAEHAQKARQPPAGFQAGKDNGTYNLLYSQRLCNGSVLL
jgi:hypothetical protein